MRERGLDPESIELREVGDPEEAERQRFVGSPTIRVNGEDVEPPGAEPAGLTCRLYRRPDGRTSPLPDPERVREALAAAGRRA